LAELSFMLYLVYRRRGSARRGQLVQTRHKTLFKCCLEGLSPEN